MVVLLIESITDCLLANHLNPLVLWTVVDVDELIVLHSLGESGVMFIDV